MLAKRLHPFFLRLLDDWMPRHCALCEARTVDAAGLGLCAGCLIALPGRNVQRCRYCARRLSPARPLALGIEPLCQLCEARETPQAVEPLEADSGLDSIYAACDYAPPLDRWITAMKYGGDPALAAPLGALLIPQGLALASRVNRIIAIPPSSRRLVERGFDHTAHLTAPLARVLGLERQRRFQPKLLARTRDTPEQAGLDQHARRRNLQGAFVAQPRAAGQSILLIDDVMTTGSTLREAARALRAQGARTVIALVIARAHSIR
ncbi:MAG: ComF family protein [Betaproteobacteria bacterium]|nr:ComF family protein [Betaproteobacteria bacterium]